MLLLYTLGFATHCCRVSLQLHAPILLSNTVLLSRRLTSYCLHRTRQSLYVHFLVDLSRHSTQQTSRAPAVVRRHLLDFSISRSNKPPTSQLTTDSPTPSSQHLLAFPMSTSPCRLRDAFGFRRCCRFGDFGRVRVVELCL